MARGDKMGKKVRKVASKKRSAVHKMVEALIRGDSETAADELRTYLQMQTRDLVLGETKDEDMDDESEDKDDDSDEDEDSDEDSDEDDSEDEDSDEDSDEDEECDKDKKSSKK